MPLADIARDSYPRINRSALADRESGQGSRGWKARQ
jgi:hypothetical protein